MKGGAVSFLVGVIVGYEGVKIATHAFYLIIIVGLITAHFYLR